jgi:hypothetical protein
MDLSQVQELTGVVLSDLHSLSVLSPVVPDFKTIEGHKIDPSPAQFEMYRCFSWLAEKWHKPDRLMLLGDLINMPERYDPSWGVWSANPLDGINNAVELIKMYEAKKIYVIRGTARHVMIENMPSEEVLARKLRACKIGTGGYVSAIKYMPEKWGFRFHFAHHVPSSQTEWFLTTPLAKEGIRLQLQHKRTGHIDAVFRGHNHYWVYVQFRSQHLISCPCWQLPTEYMHRKSGEPLTDIGGVRFRLSKEPDQFGERFRVEKELFPIIEGETKPYKW